MKRLLTLLGCLGLAVAARAQYHFYFGNIHAHTAYSDGSKDNHAPDPASAYAYAKGAYHMDFLGISEHNHYTANGNPGMHVGDFIRGSYQADTANRDGSFICLFGMEYGVISNGGHVIIYGVPGLIGWEAGNGNWGALSNYDIYNEKYNYATLWQTLREHPSAFATLAHPDSYDYGSLLEGVFNPGADSVVVGCAIRSGSAFSTTKNYTDNPATSYESKYFRALSRGYHLGPTIDHDNHYTTFGRTTHTRTVVLARSLARDSIMAAYRASRFYASDDWDAEVTFLVNDHVMGTRDTTSADTRIHLSIQDMENNNGGQDPTAKIDLYYGIPGSALSPAILASVSDAEVLDFVHPTQPGDSFYYFAKIRQADGDLIWTAPVWMTRVAADTGSPAVGVEAPAFVRSQPLNLYPNPAQDAVALDLEAPSPGTYVVRIYNLQGRQVYQAAPQVSAGLNRISLDISHLTKGMYLLVLSNEQGRLGQSRLLKQ